jgi:ElaB/YqjD/DUF883 family membrane-anchored ribosome-binding protein
MDLYFMIGRKPMSKKLIAFAAMLALAFGMTACEKETPSGNASNAAKSAGQTAANAANATGKAVGDAAKATGNAVGNAAQATGDWLAGSKDSAVKFAQDKVADLETKWQTLQDKAAPTTDAAKADLQKAKDQMSQTLADAKAKLVQAKDATDDAWQKDIKPALAAALDKAQKLYDSAAAEFGGK